MSVVGVKFNDKGKKYYFESGDIELKENITVIVETEKGLQFGKVVSLDEDYNDENIKKVIRKSSKRDYLQHLNNLKDAKTALEKCREMVEKNGLNMIIIDANYTFDRNQLIFRFIADERIDFRELAKRLAGLYKTRIELRQIGARDKARTICGIGQCGRPLCCSSFLNHIDSVTMNMAKNQGIALNPSKINGLCGRLLCCLTYEDEEYSRCQKGLPNVGQTVKTDQGSGKVISVDILNRKYKVDVDGIIKEIELGCDKCKK